jgi:predicted nucleic acid-binding protein
LTRNKTSEDNAKIELARELILAARHSMSAQVVAEVCTNLLRKGLATEPELAELVDDFYKEHAVFPIDQPIFRMDSSLRMSYSLSFWDSLIVASALQSDAQILYTEDMQHGLIVDGRMRIVNPFLQE